MPKIPPRILRAVETLDVSPDDHVLEIGGGPGVSAALICGILAWGDGRYLGLDRSALATKRASARNAAHASAGRAEFRTQDLTEAPLPPAAFDRILAVNVNLFWTNPAGPALAILRRALRENGRIVLVFEGVSSDASLLRVRERTLRAGLERHGFKPVRAEFRESGTHPPRLVVIGGAGR